jgi:hypothetical protein
MKRKSSSYRFNREHAYASLNPFDDALAYCIFLKAELENRPGDGTGQANGNCRYQASMLYPLAMDHVVLSLSFMQLANLPPIGRVLMP